MGLAGKEVVSTPNVTWRKGRFRSGFLQDAGR